MTSKSMYATRRAETSIEKQGVNRYVAVFFLATTFAITGTGLPVINSPNELRKNKDLLLTQIFIAFIYYVQWLGLQKSSQSVEIFGNWKKW